MLLQVPVEVFLRLADLLPQLEKLCVGETPTGKPSGTQNIAQQSAAVLHEMEENEPLPWDRDGADEDEVDADEVAEVETTADVYEVVADAEPADEAPGAAAEARAAQSGAPAQAWSQWDGGVTGPPSTSASTTAGLSPSKSRLPVASSQRSTAAA